MPVPLRVHRLFRDLNLAGHLAIHTAVGIIADAAFAWRERHNPHRHRSATMPHTLARIVRYHVTSVIGGRDLVAVDGDHNGRRQTRRHQGEVADRRRRHVTMLLNTLGTNPDAVQASLTRHWQLIDDEWPGLLIEDYLTARLAHRDRHALHPVDVYAWACNVGGTWIATPGPVRRYLRHANAHEQTLASVRPRRPRRGVRTVPDRGIDQFLATAINR